MRRRNLRGAAAAASAALVVAFALALVVPAIASSRAGPIYFWANLGNPVKTPVHGFPNPPVIRPSTFVIFEDGQWVIEKLHWTDWGSPVAKATGKSSSSDDKPNAVEGKRIITWAKVTLYDPGVFEGRRVYRCIRIKVPPPADFGTRCLQRTGKSVGLGTPGFGTPVGGETTGGGARHVDEFFSPGRKVWCQISLFDRTASCGSYPEPPTHSATLEPNGRVEICSVEKLEYPEGAGHGPPAGCFQNWPPDPLPILRPGETTTVAGTRCTSASDGITCIRAGHGFRVNADEAVEVPGGHS
jgi:hypothetical protein